MSKIGVLVADVDVHDGGPASKARRHFGPSVRGLRKLQAFGIGKNAVQSACKDHFAIMSHRHNLLWWSMRRATISGRALRVKAGGVGVSRRWRRYCSFERAHNKAKVTCYEPREETVESNGGVV